MWGKKFKKVSKINTFWGVLHHLTAKFNLKTSSLMHSNYGFTSLKKSKTPTKIKILEDKIT